MSIASSKIQSLSWAAPNFPRGGGGGQEAGHVGADISHGRALDGCMDDNWGAAGGGGQGQGTGGGGSGPLLDPPMPCLLISSRRLNGGLLSNTWIMLDHSHSTHSSSLESSSHRTQHDAFYSCALWKLVCSVRHRMINFSTFTYRFYSQTVPVLSLLVCLTLLCVAALFVGGALNQSLYCVE